MWSPVLVLEALIGSFFLYYLTCVIKAVTCELVGIYGCGTIPLLFIGPKPNSMAHLIFTIKKIKIQLLNNEKVTKLIIKKLRN